MLKPITLNNLTIAFPVALGPMAGVTDLPFRALAASQGCGLFYTEMISAKALYYRNPNTEVLMETGETDRPIGVQLFGSEPEILAEEALKLEDRFDFIDLNMGCPVPKIVKNGEGSYLLGCPELARDIFTRMVRTVHKPVTVKIRTSFSGDPDEGLRVARIAEDCGVSMIAVHGRTRSQYYSGKADWSAIRRIREQVSVPVIGNGDIFSAADAKRMLEETGVDGVMAARGAQGNPWLFREIRGLLTEGAVPPRPTQEEINETILRHARMLIRLKGPHTAVLEMRKHAAWYLQGQPNAAALRRALNDVSTLEALEEVIR